MHEFRNTLVDWETILRRQVGGGDVLLGQLPLGEPPYNEADMNRLGNLLARMFFGYRIGEALKKVEGKYPLSFALYLVLMGIYNYQSGTYWPFVDDQLGFSGTTEKKLCTVRAWGAEFADRCHCNTLYSHQPSAVEGTPGSHEPQTVGPHPKESPLTDESTLYLQHLEFYSILRVSERQNGFQ